MVQIWPTDDNFSQAGTDFTYPNRYVRFDPGSVTYPDGVLIASAPGDMVSLATSTGYGAANIVRTVAARNTASSFYARTPIFSDGEVTASFERVTRAGAISGSTLSRLAVYGRVNKSAFNLVSVDGEYIDEYLDRPDCIEFAFIKGTFLTPADCYFVVGYYTAGVYTTLGEIRVEDWATATLAVSPGLSYYEMSRLRMVMSGTSIKCYIKPKNGYAVPTTAPVRTVDGEIEVFSVFAPISSGYAGVGIPGMWQTATWTGGHAVDWFQVKTGGSIMFRDEFKRAAVFGAHVVDPFPPLPTAGVFRSIAGAYSGDGASDSYGAGSAHPFLVKPYIGLMHGVSSEIHIGRSIPASFADPGYQSANYGFMYDTHDFGVYPQRRQLDFEFNSGGGASCGIILRGWVLTGQPEPRLRDLPTTPDDVVWDPLAASGVITPYGKEGYCCIITHDALAATPWLLRILRFVHQPPGSNHTFPTTVATADLALFSLVVGVTIELDFEVRNFNALPDGSGGNLAMRVAVDGVGVDLIAEDLPGLSFQDGWLYDLSAPPSLYTNTMSGMFAETYVDWASTTADHVVLNRWQHLALSDPPVTTDPEQPSVALEAEDYGKTGTFSSPIDWQVKEERNRSMREMRTEAHYRYKSPIGSRVRRSWSLTSSGITDDELTTIIQFIESHKGPEIPFDWYRADTGGTIPVRYMGNSLSYRKDTLGSNTCSLSFEEVFPEAEYNAQA